MGPEIISLIGGIPFLPGPLERSSTVYMYIYLHIFSFLEFDSNLICMSLTHTFYSHDCKFMSNVPEVKRALSVSTKYGRHGSIRYAKVEFIYLSRYDSI